MLLNLVMFVLPNLLWWKLVCPSKKGVVKGFKNGLLRYRSLGWLKNCPIAVVVLIFRQKPLRHGQPQWQRDGRILTRANHRMSWEFCHGTLTEDSTFEAAVKVYSNVGR